MSETSSLSVIFAGISGLVRSERDALSRAEPFSLRTRAIGCSMQLVAWAILVYYYVVYCLLTPSIVGLCRGPEGPLFYANRQFSSI